MLTDQHDEGSLFNGFDSLVPERSSALRAIGQTRQLLLLEIQPSEKAGTANEEESTWSRPRNSRSSMSSRTWAFVGIGFAAAALLLVVGGVYFFGIRNPRESGLQDRIADGKSASPPAKLDSRPREGSAPIAKPDSRPMASSSPAASSGPAANKPPDSSLRLKPGEGDAKLLALMTEHPNFARVDVGQSRITSTGLAQLQRLKNLTHLSLDGMQVTAENTGHLQNLSRLKGVEIVRATDETVVHLKELKNLTELGLSNSGKLTDDGLAHLAGMNKLQRLSLTNNDQIGDAGLAHLKGLDSIRELKLNGTGVTDEGLAHLIKLRNLKHLDLSRTTIGDSGLQQMENLTGLQELQLGDTRVTDAGLAHLSSLTDLSSLGLYRLKVTDDGMQHLKPLKKLKVLGLYGTQVSDAAVEELRKGLAEAPPSTFGNR